MVFKLKSTEEMVKPNLYGSKNTMDMLKCSSEVRALSLQGWASTSRIVRIDYYVKTRNESLIMNF